MGADQVIELINLILTRQGKGTAGVAPKARLRDLQFRSLDFSELCLRVEVSIGKELNFEAAELRRIETVEDVCRFVDEATD